MRWFGLKSYSLILALLCSSVANAAITPNLSHGSTVENSGGVNSYTIAFTCDATSDLITFAWATYQGAGSETPTGVTYNSVSMTLKVSAYGPDNATHTGESAFIYTLTGSNCDGSSHNFVITLGANSSFGGVAMYASHKGVDQATPVGNTASNTGSGTSVSSPLTDSITVASGNYALDASILATSAMTVGGSQTQITKDAWGGDITGSSYLQDATAMSWTFTSGPFRASQAIIEIKASGGGGGGAQVRHRVVTP